MRKPASKNKLQTMFDIQRYSPEKEKEWNGFVASSKNATFLLDRGYMDYHAYRFHDCSLMFYKNGRLYALLPAHAAEGTLVSHPGLTYGGLVLGEDARGAEVVTLFQEMNDWLRGEGFRAVTYKRIPWIYHKMPAEEDLYALFRVCRAKLVCRDISSAIDMAHAPHWSQNRRWGRNKAFRQGVEVTESQDFPTFWKILSDNLRSRYGTAPVHSLEEIRLLHSRFPQSIRLYLAYKDEEAIGGTVLYVTPQVVHSQYISSSPRGKELNAVDAVFERVLHQDFARHAYFDFGKSTVGDGRELNASLLAQKEGFGARALCYDTYAWEL